MNKSIGQIIRELRQERNITQEELAELISVTPQAVSKWEREVGYPDIAQIVPLANVFGVSTDVLFGVFGTNDNEEVEKIINEIDKNNEDIWSDLQYFVVNNEEDLAILIKNYKITKEYKNVKEKYCYKSSDDLVEFIENKLN